MSTPEKPETLEQIAERLTDAISPSSACHEEDRASDYAEILVALRRAQAITKPAWLGHEHRPGCTPDHGPRPVGPAAPETLEQIAERLERCKDCGAIFVCSCGDGPTKPGQVLAALHGVEARARTEADQKARDEAAKVHSGLAATIVQEERRAEKAEADLKAANSEISFEARRIGEYIEAVSLAEERAEKAEAEVERLRVERDEAWAAANSAEAEMERLRNVLTTAVCSRPCCAPDRKWIGAHGFEIQAKR